MSRPSMRQARLKAEFADRYPPLESGVWIPAPVASARMQLWQASQAGASAPAQRTLDPRHFDFRGGLAEAAGPRAPGTPIRREARLRSGFAGLYPALPGDTWMGAAELGGALLRWIAEGGVTPPLGARLLPDEHFEFRGGELPSGSAASPRSRGEDPETRKELPAG